MKNYVGSGDEITLLAPSAVITGDVVQVDSLIGVATTSADSGAAFNMTTEGVFNLPKDGAAYAIGKIGYWDGSQIIATATAAVSFGVVTKAALAGDAEVEISLLDSSSPVVTAMFALAAKLDADLGVSDTNYVAVLAALL